MKGWGIGLTIFGVLALFGKILNGGGASGPFCWIALGLFLIHKANEKKKERKKEAEKEASDGKDADS